MPDKPVHLRTLLDSAFPVTCVKCECSLKETKLFNFHWIFKKRGTERGFERTSQTPSGSATALEGEQAKLRCGDFFSSLKFTI